MPTIHRLSVTFKHRPVPARVVNEVMDDIDPGTWGHDHPLAWSCPVSAARYAEMVRDEFRPTRGFNVVLTTETEKP